MNEGGKPGNPIHPTAQKLLQHRPTEFSQIERGANGGIY